MSEIMSFNQMDNTNNIVSSISNYDSSINGDYKITGVAQ